MDTITPPLKTYGGPLQETNPFSQLHTFPEVVTTSPDSRITSDPRPRTAGQPSSIPTTTRPNKNTGGILRVITSSASPGSRKSSPASSPVTGDSSSQAEIVFNQEEEAQSQTIKLDKMMTPVSSVNPHAPSDVSSDFRLTTPATSGPEPSAASFFPEFSTPSARELRVKINQVAAFIHNSLSPNGRLPDRHPKNDAEEKQGGNRPDGKLPTRTSPKVTILRRDCSDHLIRGAKKSGMYMVTPDLRSRTIPVFCDMELHGGGWTLIQRRQDGSVNFNRMWDEYKSGFGELKGGEFWLGNDKIHLLTRTRDMMLRVELEDVDGMTGYAEYEQFKVASERLYYRLTVGGYSGTAGDALLFSKSYDHNNRPFTTPDKDHDRYPSGNCGAYYSSGWWFDACMAANLNGKYYFGRYKGVRNGIYWGTWHNISTEYYPTNERQAFRSVRMMIRPKGFAP
ncbi:fibroleukin-like [Genypterus blacodes]|uniref:fibroleukin-like n=1 Tax=Genypterus blacodes TaxID=154954 RepID=UPI003F75B96D